MDILAKFKRLIHIAGDRRWWSFYLQRKVMDPTERDRRAQRLAARRRAAAGSGAAVESDRKLAEDGLHPLGGLLDVEQCRQIREHLEACKVADPYKPASRFLPLSSERAPGSHVAYHTPADVASCSPLVALANRPELLRIAEGFLGCPPLISYMAAWWSYPTGLGAQQAEFFHRDVDDWRFLKLFVYLTDTTADNGAHMYVTRSAFSPHLQEIRRFSDVEVEARFDKEAIRVIPGEAGDGFFENTYGLHRGLPVERGVRLIFQAVYSLNPLPYGPRKPIASLPAGMDRNVNSVYFR